MKDFPKIVLGSALGFIIASIFISIIFMLFFFITAGSLVKSVGEEQFVPANNSVLNLCLSGNIKERIPRTTTFMPKDETAAMGLDDIIAAIRKAKNDHRIKGIYLNPRIFSASPATLAQIRQELIDFKESGKFIVAYADTYTQSGYYLASVADKIAVNPQGSLDIHGLASMPVFYKDALEKLGIEVQVFKVGTYKSAVEPFTLTEMSEANRQQTTSSLNDIWSFMRSDLANSRHLSIDEVDSVANQFPLLKETAYLINKNLVDTVLYETEMKNYLRTLLNIDKEDKIPSATVRDMKSVPPPIIKKSKNNIALLYAVGNIVSGNGSSDIQDKFMVNEIEKLRKDDNIKAVVFRVNSGGGSAYASEQIWKAITDLKKEKPVVVSMGDLAASGGYYISCNASKIVAQPTTITGSIGIFGLFPNMQGTMNKLGLNFDVVKTHKYGDFGNLSRPMNKDEKAMLQSYIDKGYDTFLSRCAEGRNIPKDTLAKYAEGRIWTGNQAKTIGLVDELGGIEKAIKIAADLANLDDDYVVYEYPRKRSLFEELFYRNKNDLALKTLKEYLGDSYDIFMTIKNLKEEDFIQARLPYVLNIQ
ncbi:MAG: signal peptide peptidase SppA [Dysgonamonadaceae bacterium]|jgi:protease-4|nr:signal peptide peptidase SppA [Dysgonamonadaceae bacterium]NLH29182.1 signal peptide peptidase SppA [Bacteroidales bacterium]